MLETRKCWFQAPCEYDDQCRNPLDTYRARTSRWPIIPFPGTEAMLAQILNSRDSAPGPDGIPYAESAAWRILPRSAEAMIEPTEKFNKSTTFGSVDTKGCTLGATADYWPLGMPSTFERNIDGAVAAVAVSTTAPLLHPSQTVLNTFREPQSAVQNVRTYLDSQDPAVALSLDLSKAVERVNPYWILEIFAIREARTMDYQICLIHFIR